MNVADLTTVEIERFWAKVDKRLHDECWNWKGSCQKRKDGSGYGSFSVWLKNGKTKGWLAHRLAYELTHGSIPIGMFVCHSCDNPPCCNPHHLWVGTSQDNSDDMKSKNRQAKGSSDGNSRLTENQVLEIRTIYSAGGITQIELAQKFAVSRQTIMRVLRDSTAWSHVENVDLPESSIFRSQNWNSQRGTAHYRAKLSAVEVQQIREIYASQSIRQEDLGRQFGVSKQTVARVISRKSYKDVS